MIEHRNLEQIYVLFKIYEKFLHVILLKNSQEFYVRCRPIFRDEIGL